MKTFFMRTCLGIGQENVVDVESKAISSAVHLGWSLRDAVESNWWDSLPRASDPEFTKALRELAREIYGAR
jgi:hypothetical protein